jgi:hypothetical protein
VRVQGRYDKSAQEIMEQSEIIAMLQQNQGNEGGNMNGLIIFIYVYICINILIYIHINIRIYIHINAYEGGNVNGYVKTSQSNQDVEHYKEQLLEQDEKLQQVFYFYFYFNY